jgi:hypothetical protein
MRRALVLFAPIALAVGGWQFHQNYELDTSGGGIPSIKPRAPAVASVDPAAAPAPATGALRLGSFNLDPLGEPKLRHGQIADVLAAVVRRFDVLAVQGIRADSPDVLAELLPRVNATGRQYQYVLGPRVGQAGRQQQFAFLYDSARVDADRDTAYTVDDPDRLLTYDPLVVEFAARGDGAFTFTMVNVLVDPTAIDRELPAAGSVFRAVRDDGRQEDDILMVGDFGASAQAAHDRMQLPYTQCILSSIAAGARGTALVENFIIDRRATIEFTGHSGAIDLMQEFSLNAVESLEIADGLPVFAEFYAQEGLAGRVAKRRAERPPLQGSYYVGYSR